MVGWCIGFPRTCRDTALLGDCRGSSLPLWHACEGVGRTDSEDARLPKSARVAGHDRVELSNGGARGLNVVLEIRTVKRSREFQRCPIDGADLKALQTKVYGSRRARLVRRSTDDV